MQVQVETYVDEGGAERLRRLYLDSRVIEVVDNIDQWHGADYRYVGREQDESDPPAREGQSARDDLAISSQQRTGDGDNPAQSVSLRHRITTGLVALGVA